LAALPAARQIKLYNSGSFFDVRAIPTADYESIALIARRFERTILECHPLRVAQSCAGFRDLIGSQLEIAMGLETAHPEVLNRLNKRMTLDQFARSAEYLRRNDIDLRVFVLVHPPFMRPEESFFWAQRSSDFAFDCGATAATLIPTRGGNGAMESLAQIGQFTPPSLATVEAAACYGVGLGRGRVFVDLWDIPNRPNACRFCLADRVDRLHRINLSQRLLPSIECLHCEALS
jgi:radical SAM enzyme (TIGR01210 family)